MQKYKINGKLPNGLPFILYKLCSVNCGSVNCGIPQSLIEELLHDELLAVDDVETLVGLHHLLTLQVEYDGLNCGL